MPGAGVRLQFVLLFGDHDAVKSGFLLCAKKIKKAEFTFIAICKVIVRVEVRLIRS
jgi:hypothetical protein